MDSVYRGAGGIGLLSRDYRSRARLGRRRNGGGGERARGGRSERFPRAVHSVPKLDAMQGIGIDLGGQAVTWCAVRAPRSSTAILRREGSVYLRQQARIFGAST